jgi:hypothetical protein
MTQVAPGFDKSKEIGLEHFAGRLDIVKLPVAERL